MELWIRSQDKTKLIKADGLYIKEYRIYNSGNLKEYRIDSYIICSEKIDIGKYLTKARALDVLDEIQDELIGSCFMPVNEEEVLTCGSAKIYEMPEE